MGIVSFICLTYPDTTLGVAFLPFITFSAANVSNFIQLIVIRLIII